MGPLTPGLGHCGKVGAVIVKHQVFEKDKVLIQSVSNFCDIKTSTMVNFKIEK